MHPLNHFPAGLDEDSIFHPARGRMRYFDGIDSDNPPTPQSEIEARRLLFHVEHRRRGIAKYPHIAPIR